MSPACPVAPQTRLRIGEAGLTFGLLLALHAMPATGQGYPSRPVRLVVPFATGGGLDLDRKSTRLNSSH